MKFSCPLVTVSDVDKSRKFYETLLEQKVRFDFGENIMFEGNFAIQQKSHYARMVSIDEKDMVKVANNFELYFEETNFDAFIEKLRNYNDIKYLHHVKEHSWGQRVVRFYDPDMNIIEVGEYMQSVIRRYLSKGFTIEETAKKTQHPIEFIKNCI